MTPPTDRDAALRTVEGTGVPLRGDDIDTDQIIPARFVKVVTFDGLGEFAFFDQRYTDDDEPKDHPFNDERFQDASVLVVNANFGCGSSREHAPQALVRWGIDAIVGESFADIFAGNCLMLGIPTATADSTTIAQLQDWVECNPDGEITLDVVDETVSYGDRTAAVTVPDTHKRALSEGTWDTTGLLRAEQDRIREVERSLPYLDPRVDD